jgi:hypothetical protein
VIDITKQYVQELFLYEESSGNLIRKKSVSTNTKAGDVVGIKNSHGYLHFRINRKLFFVHRVVWLFHKGSWPTGVIDHINRNKLDNRIENLRDTTIQANNINKDLQRNNKTGIRNVSWRDRNKVFCASCRRGGKQNYLGEFKNAKDAEQAVIKFRQSIGEL